MHLEDLLEVPQLVPPEDWNLGNQQANLARAAWFKRNPAETYRDFPTATLLVQAGNVGGQIGLISKRTGLLEYYVHYEIANLPPLGRSATQVKLWRSDVASVQGLARMGLEDILLARFETVVSDTQQTDRGREFWRVQMGGFANSKTVGLLDRTGIHCYDQIEPIADWLKQQDGWGHQRSYRRKRFFISNLPLAAIMRAPS